MKQININNEIEKQKYLRDEIASKIENLKEEYRMEIVNNCVDGLLTILNEEGSLSKRDMEIYIKNMSLDIRNLYFR